MGSLPEELTAPFEEHLLICETCRNRVRESDDFVHSMKAAVTEMGKPELTVKLATVGPVVAPGGSPLFLLPDLSDLVVAPTDSVELTDELGNSTWRGALPGIHVTSLPIGRYRVRIHAGAGEVLREYSLHIQ